MAEEPNIGPDPLKWIERLREVNTGSQFADEQRTAIDRHLCELSADLIRMSLRNGLAEAKRVAEGRGYELHPMLKS